MFDGLPAILATGNRTITIRKDHKQTSSFAKLWRTSRPISPFSYVGQDDTKNRTFAQERRPQR
ncbi:MAG: hypothetical protein C5B58_11100 [Acidobacteria bacterium]|nr:MAG: hypothetical protein C5B58_11100 [Acidobacteriota bacterium]